MTESFIKPAEYLNLIGIRVWVIRYEHTGMVIRTCVFLWENCMETVTLKKVLIESIYYI